ncbi:MAG: hypothetical protein HFG23_02075 [Anaerotruncus sp.]|nr:hypothetical protein [Anaerotruncus sp.]
MGQRFYNIFNNHLPCWHALGG